MAPKRTAPEPLIPKRNPEPEIDPRENMANLDEVVMKKSDLLDALEENRAAHQDVFDRAMEGYSARAIELLEEHIMRIKQGKVELVQVILPQPVNHLKDYDRIIAAMEASIYDTVVLTSREFAMYYMDDWSWKQEFLASTSMYAS